MKRFFSKLWRVTFALVVLLVAFGIFLSATPQNAVRLRLIVAGHPSSAIKCHPEYDRWMSHKAKKPVYDISRKYQFEPFDGGGNASNMFEINHFLFLHWATPTWDFYV